MIVTPRTVTIPHLGRVEGHGGIHVTLEGPRVADVNLDIHEGSRYYEKLLVGKHFRDVQGIITRVCAICSADHTVAALAALESALGVPVSHRTRALRGLLLRGAAIESHALHVFALALPDFLGFDSLMGLAERYPDEVAFALRLKQLGNRIQEVIGGRAVHPINTLVGGFGKLPSHREIESLRSELVPAMSPLLGAVDMVASIDIPEWAERNTLFVALRPARNHFGFRGDVICTSNGTEYPVEAYRDTVREFTVEHSTARHAALESGETYMVGSLARLGLWGDRLGGAAAQAFDVLFPDGVTDNVLFNTRAQAVEMVYCLESAIQFCDSFLGLEEIASEMQPVAERAGRGIGAIEAPRGTLFHEYELGEDGRVTAANVVTPTAQNLANIERDLRTSGDRLQRSGNVSDAELKKGFEMVARAYDPCISCSVHLFRNDG
jgi:sulfhydrogenase subunit alpha